MPTDTLHITDGDEDKEKDSKFETFVTKKTIAQGMLDIGLLTANASQMKSLISLGSGQEFYYVNMVLISLSIFLQVIVGLVLLKLGSVKYKQPSGTHQAERLNHFVMALLLIVIVLNVFIAAFGIEEKNKTT